MKKILNRIAIIFLTHPSKWEWEFIKLRKKEEDDNTRKNNNSKRI